MRVNPSIRETRTDAELWEADATAYLTTVAQQLRPALETELVVAMASPADTIQVEARLLGADLIVMAAHGGHGFKSYALGDVTERLLTGPTPVLIVRLGQLERLERWLGHGTAA
jgi:nucleotide-binding universal stress UspA family protein